MIKIAVLVATMAIPQWVFAADARELAVGISDAYIPRTSPNSDALVVVNGIFQNGCYRWSRASVDHLANNVHEIRTFALVQPGMCIMVLIPFTKEIPLGRLSSGTHRLRFLNGDGTYIEKQMKVE
jgi:hypothetical protein